MPIYEVQGADGKTYEVDAADENTALNAFSAHTQAAPSQTYAVSGHGITPTGHHADTDLLGTLDAGVRSAANTVTLGAADHLAAWANSMAGVDKTPDAAGIAAGEKTPLEKQRGYDEQANTDHPVASTIGGLAGALAAPETGLFKAAPLAKGITDAAFQGGVSGFNGADGGWNKSIGGAIGGAGLGGALGAIAPVLSRVGGATRDASDLLFDPSGKNYSMRRIGEAAQKTGTDIPAMVRGLEASRTTAPDFAAVDQLGNPGAGLAGAAIRNAGEGGEALRQQLVNRQMDSGERVKSIIGGTLGDPASYHGTLDDAIQGMKTQAKPYYDSAYATPIDYAAHPELQDLLTRVPPSATTRANKLMSIDGIQSKQILQSADGSQTPLPDMTQWDYIKQGMDSLIGKAKTSGDNRYVRSLTGLKNEILPILDSAVPDYGKARSIFKGDADVKDALETGRAGLNADPEAIAKMVSGAKGPNRLIPDPATSAPASDMLSDAEKKAYGIGISRATADAVDKTKSTGDTLSNIWNSPIMKNRLQAAVGDDAKFGDMSAKLNQEGAMSRTFQKINGNSATAERLKDDSNLTQSSLGEALKLLLTGRPIQALGSVGTQVAKIGTGLTHGRADQLSQDLGSDGQDLLARYAKRGAMNRSFGAMGDVFNRYGGKAVRMGMAVQGSP
ncbi:MAG: hypothetical protein ABI230_00605 [Aestuariivirga sp.]